MIMTEIEAIYHNGKLELKTPLPLAEGQSVRVIVVEQETERLAAMEQAADTWLKLQSNEVVELSPDIDWEKLNTEWDELFAEIRTAFDNVSEEEISRDVEHALREVRKHYDKK
jgi:predicted DNA-binding antitoxin AbrB/MazE fold protein